MKLIHLLLLLFLGQLSFGQDMEEQEFLKKGKIKLTYVNYADKYAEPDYTEFKKISEIRKVDGVDGEVHSMEIYCEKSGTLKYSREFVARGNINDDGTMDNVFGYYSDRADMWAVPYDGSIYIINASIRNIKSSKDLVIPYVLGENIAERIDLFNYYKEIYAAYSGEKFEREAAESKEKQMAKEMAQEELLNNFSIERNNIESIKVIHKWSPYINFGERSVIIGIDATLDNGHNIKSKLFDGVAIDDEFIYEIEGAHDFDQYNPTSNGGYCHLYVSHKEKPTSDDCVKVKVKRRSTGELLAEDKINIDYDYSLYFSFKGDGGIRGYAGDDGADVIVDIEQIEHSETWEPLLLYKIQYDYGTTDYDGNPNKGTKYVKMNPTTELKITYHGGDGGNGNTGGYAGGKEGSLVLNVASNVEEYNFVHFGIDGESGYADYQGEVEYSDDYSSSSDYSSDEITVENETGQSVCVAHSGGSTSIGNGSSETFSCRDLYYGVMDGASCTGTFGSKIADEDNDCGRTITLE